MNRFNYKKAVQIINFFSRKEGNSIDKLKLMKLVWLADRLHVRKYGRLISDDNYFAMGQGPVASCTLDLIDSDKITYSPEQIDHKNQFITKIGNNINSIAPVNTKLFSKSDIIVMEEIYDSYHKYSGIVLSNISHRFPEWLRHKADLNRGEKRKKIDFNDFFENISEYTDFPNMNLDKDHLELSKEFFLERHPS